MTKVNLNKKLNYDDYIDHEETVGELLQNILKMSFNTYYKDINYVIEASRRDENGQLIIAILTNADKNSETIPWSKVEFPDGVEHFAKVLETFRLHDGTLLYDALTKKGYEKFFG